MYLVWPKKEFISGFLHHRFPLREEGWVGSQPESDGLFQKTQGGFVMETV